jgi:adenylate cyclase
MLRTVTRTGQGPCLTTLTTAHGYPPPMTCSAGEVRALGNEGVHRLPLMPGNPSRSGAEQDVATSATPGAERRLRVDFFRAVVGANLLGVLVVAAFLTLVVPVPAEFDRRDALLVNLAALGYVLVAIPVGLRWGGSLAAPVIAWLSAGRPPTASERVRTLEFPLLGFKVLGPLWVGGALLNGIFNATISSPGYGVLTGVTIVLGGVTTCTVIVLWAERTLRDVLASALDSGVPEEPVGPGVGTRMMLAWGLGTGVPLVGVVLVAGAVLLGTDLSAARLASTALFLGTLGLGVGLLAMWIAGRSVADPVEAVRAAQADVERGNLQAEVRVSQGSEVGLLAAGFNRMAAGLRERERIREAFGTYVDREVAEHILREGTSLAGEEVEVTMMFIDIRNFTGFAERSSATEVVATINRLFERAVPIIQEHGGHVDKFVGDGLLAVFGAPRRQENHADLAFAAALEIERAVGDAFGGELSIGIGLNSGTVVAGNVGGGGRLEFSVIGDAVNVAARVEAATRKTGDTVLISEHTRRLLSASSAASLEERPTVPLKGKTQAVALFAPATHEDPESSERLADTPD